MRAVKKGLMDTSRSAQVHSAALVFAKAWAAWHNTSEVMPSHDVIESASGILEALGVDMIEGRTGKYRIVRAWPK